MALPAIPQLASNIGPMILPYLPYLLGGVKKAGEAIEALGKKAGTVQWDTIFKIWEKLRPQVEKQPEVKQRLEEVAKKAEDPRAEMLLSWELEKILAALKPDEVTEIQNIITMSKAETRTTTASGERSVAVGGDVSGSTFITGDDNTIKK